MAEIAKRYQILRRVATAGRPRKDVVYVKKAVGIALAIAADLALKMVTSLNQAREFAPL